MLNYKIIKLLFFIIVLLAHICYVSFEFSYYYILIIPILYIGIIAWGSSTIRANFFMNSICSANILEKKIALTFDDGPDLLKTPAILDFLGEKNIKVTFFVIGKKIKGAEYLIERIVKEGHIIANHSHSHSYFFDFFTTKRIISDLDEATKTIATITGNSPNWFRPPYGVTNPTISRAIEVLKLTSIGWDVRSLDTVIKDSNKLYQRVIKRIKPGSILLFHDTGVSTLELLKEVILFAQNNGYEIIGLDDLLSIKPYEEV